MNFVTATTDPDGGVVSRVGYPRDRAQPTRKSGNFVSTVGDRTGLKQVIHTKDKGERDEV